MQGTARVALIGAVVALLWSASAALAQTANQASQATAAAASGIQVAGTLKVHVKLTASPSLPNGTQITVSVSASVFDDSFNNLVALSQTTQVTGGNASLVVTVPYTWLVASTDDQVTVSVAISGSAADSKASYQDSTALTQTIALPATGAMTPLTFTGSI